MAVVQRSEIGFLGRATVPFSNTSPQHAAITVSVRTSCKMAALSTTLTLSLAETFFNLRRERKVAFIPYITAGDPDMSTTAKALQVLDSCGSDIIELGVPYSDPLADGPVIQEAATRSLARGTNFHAITSMLKEVIPKLTCPIVLFTYYNPILKHGIDSFLSDIHDIGVRGLVVPDVPLEEIELLRKESINKNIELVLLTTLTTPTERMRAIAEASQGFIYLVSTIGVTGVRESISGRVETFLHEIKKATSKPVAVGFGVSKSEHVKQLAEWGADGVIVGSAMVKLLGEAKSGAEGLRELEIFTKSLVSPLVEGNYCGIHVK